MGSGGSTEEPQPGFPTTGKPLVVRLTCRHNGQTVDIQECRGCCVTSEWTAANLVEAIEQHVGVHRKCQTLMFAGKQMRPGWTIQELLGAPHEQLPPRITIFLNVNRELFPQKLGPFAMVLAPFETEDFQLPKLTQDIRAGFYWEMKTGILECYGLRARARSISGQVSPLHPVLPDQAWQQAVGMPEGAVEFGWSYPVADWERVESDAYGMDSWESLPATTHRLAIKSFLTVGGILFLDEDGGVVGATTSGRPSKDTVGLGFGEPQRWRHEWTQSLAERGRFQPVTMKSLEVLGAKVFCWLRPNEVIEDEDGQPFPQQPKVPYGGLVYLWREDVMSIEPKDTALDRYFPVEINGDGVAAAEVTCVMQEQPDAALFRAFTLVEDDGLEDYPEWCGRGLRPPRCPEEESDCEVPDDDSSPVMMQQSSMMQVPTISLSNKTRKSSKSAQFADDFLEI